MEGTQFGKCLADIGQSMKWSTVEIVTEGTMALLIGKLHSLWSQTCYAIAFTPSPVVGGRVA